MKYVPSLKPATLLRRYKRFIADIVLDTGEEVSVHCPNTGSMKNCIIENSPCWYSESANPKRKYPYTLELVTTASGHLAGINTGLANKLVKEAIDNNRIQELVGYECIRSEVRYGEEKSRIDFLLQSPNRADCYVEVKSVTLGADVNSLDGDSKVIDAGLGLFPDSVSARGSKHLRELILMKEQGYRSVLVFCIQHMGIERVSPADEIDPVYGQTLREAISKGVEVFAYKSSLNKDEIKIDRQVSVVL